MVTHAYEPRGAAMQLFHSTDPELVIEGPAGTGKTRAVLEYLHFRLSNHPGIRVLGCRQTRASMTESVLVTYESKVLWDGHPAISGDAGRANRKSYEYTNGSSFVIGGLDRPSRIMSTEYDIIAIWEATEITLPAYEALLSRLRNNVLWYQQAILDCNPADEYHWINQRANRDQLLRLLSRHRDNPSVTTAYLNRLRNLTGARRARLYEGKWVSAEGQIWPEYDPATVVVDRHSEDPKTQKLVDNVPQAKWAFGSMDWGYRNPGVLQVWQVDNENRAWLVAEIYRTGQQPSWWADRVVEAYKAFNLKRIVCDPAEPDRIDLMNDRLGPICGREAPRICIPANNSMQTGLDTVREAFESDSIRIVRDASTAITGHDPIRIEEMKPTNLIQEIPSYTWPLAEDGKPIKEEPDKTCEDHSCDALRYAMMYLFNRDLDDRPPTPKFRRGSLGDTMGHAEVLERST